MVRQTVGAKASVNQYRPVSAATVWPAPGGDLTTCAPSGPTGDAPVPRGPSDTVIVRNKTFRQVLSTLCSFSVPVPKTNKGSTQVPLH
jgi:hypothetical protein